ncbi:DegV family protein [Terribacillus sp. 179-K 1B1 HS]|uniref:DegV family protein n=1 Tax=Terribacillus sp. 179-K 1B1 HS TaxID=3142388 RepID=UPI0039A133A8
MRKVKIVTDSTVDLDLETLKKHGVGMVPLSIIIDGESFLDKIEMEPHEFLERMSKAKDLPGTSQPSVGEFLEMYHRLGNDGSEIVSVHMSGEMSGTVQAAKVAASMTDVKVTVIDSMFISKALSFQVIEAAIMADEGKGAIEIVDKLSNIQAKTRLLIAIDSLENLVKGGRIGKAGAFLGSILKIKPIASLENGVLQPVAKVRNQSQIIKELLTHILKDTKDKEIKGAAIVHAGNPELSGKLKSVIKENLGARLKGITIETTTPAISTHAGIGSIAIMYYWDEK